MIQFKCRLYVYVEGSDRTLYRDAVLPIPPFIGLTIGTLAVVEVCVSQGGDSDEIVCHLEPIHETIAKILIETHRWSWTSCDE